MTLEIRIQSDWYCFVTTRLNCIPLESMCRGLGPGSLRPYFTRIEPPSTQAKKGVPCNISQWRGSRERRNTSTSGQGRTNQTSKLP